MKSSIFKILAETFKRFNDDKCWNSAIIISYFTFMCAIPLIALFAYITTKILGSSEIAFRSLNLFTEEFFAKMDPGFFQKIQAVSKNITNLGLFGFLGSLIAASFLFSNLIYTLNFIFRANYRKSFFYNRLMEYVIMVTMGIIMLFSLAITAFWTALHRTIRGNDFVENFINPDVLRFVDSFLVQYLIPYALTFLVLFSLYKLIPEAKVHTASAAIAASISEEPDTIMDVVEPYLLQLGFLDRPQDVSCGDLFADFGFRPEFPGFFPVYGRHGHAAGDGQPEKSRKAHSREEKFFFRRPARRHARPRRAAGRF